MIHRNKLNEVINTYKQKAVLYIPNAYRTDVLKTGHVTLFRDRIKEYINKHEAKSEGIYFLEISKLDIYII